MGRVKRKEKIKSKGFNLNFFSQRRKERRRNVFSIWLFLPESPILSPQLLIPNLKFRLAHRPGEGYYVPDITHARYILDEPFKAQAEARMGTVP